MVVILKLFDFMLIIQQDALERKKEATNALHFPLNEMECKF